MAKRLVNNEIDNELSVFAKIVGPREENGAAQLGDFLHFGGALNKCLRVTEGAVTNASPAIRYEIVGLEAASAAITLKPVRAKKGKDFRKEAVSLFLTTVAALQAGTPIDDRLQTPEALSAFRELATPLNERASRIEVGATVLTTEYIANVDKALGQTADSVGSVTGHLDGINVHKRTECSLYPVTTDQRIACTFPESLFEKVSAGLRRTVTIYGTQHFQHGDTAFPSRVHIDDIEVHPPDNELPTLHDVRALGAWDMGGLTAVEFVRALRDDA